MAPETAEGPRVRVIDGVREVLNSAPAWTETDAWRIAEIPSLVLGVDFGEPAEMFSNPSGLLLADGRVVIVDRGTNELRFFDEEGNHLFSRGGNGQGPGEYEGIGQVWEHPNGGLLVDDFRLQRLTRLDSLGELESTFSLQAHDMEYTRPRLVALRDDGSLLARGSKLPFEPHTVGDGEWYLGGIFRYAPDGSEPLHVLDFPMQDRGGFEMSKTFWSQGHIVGGADGRIYFSDGQSFEILTYSPAGELQQRFSRSGERIAVTDSDIETWRAQSLANIEDFGGDADSEARVAEMTFAEYMPTIAAMAADADNNIWARRYLDVHYSWVMFFPNQEPFRPDESIWDIFTPEGVWLGTVEMPPGRDVIQIGSDRILARGETDDGVQQIFVYDLIKP